MKKMKFLYAFLMGLISFVYSSEKTNLIMEKIPGHEFMLDLSDKKLVNIDKLFNGLPNEKEFDVDKFVELDLVTAHAICDEYESYEKEKKIEEYFLKQIELPGKVLQESKPTLQDVGYLYLRNNSITRLKSGNFENFPFLKKLDLSSNRLETLKKEAFKGICLLKWLNLQQNKINQIHLAAFDNFSNLEVLSLANNRLKKVPAGLFKELKKLVVLDLSENEIEEVEPGAFEKLSNLEVLQLNYNKLTRIKALTFKDLHKLEALFLGKNQIEEIEPGACKGLANLALLALAYNRLKYLNSDLIDELPNVQSLFLHGNPWELHKIPDLNLHKLKKLANLTIDEQLKQEEIKKLAKDFLNLNIQFVPQEKDKKNN